MEAAYVNSVTSRLSHQWQARISTGCDVSCFSLWRAGSDEAQSANRQGDDGGDKFKDAMDGDAQDSKRK
jgi:hypothetical protein